MVYVLRHKVPEGEGKVRISGYGVELQIKSTEYKVSVSLLLFFKIQAVALFIRVKCRHRVVCVEFHELPPCPTYFNKDLVHWAYNGKKLFRIGPKLHLMEDSLMKSLNS